MKLEYVVTASDLNYLYIQFVPIFINIWILLFPEVTPIVVLIADNIPEELEAQKQYIRLFKPIEGVSTAFISQYIRILYPALLKTTRPDSVTIISDIDMLPMNRAYYEESIRDIPNDKFVTYRDVLIDEEQYALCYNAASQKVWQEILSIRTEEDIITYLKEVYKRINYETSKGWSADQLDLFITLNEWNKKTNNHIILNDKQTKYKRLDRHTFYMTEYIAKEIKDGLYTDYHAYRPYNQFPTINNLIFNFLKEGIVERNQQQNNQIAYLHPLFTQIIKKHIGEPKVIVEAGARFGDESIALSEYYKNAHIYSFECNPEVLSKTRKNLEDKQRITLTAHALGAEEAIEPFYSYKEDNPGSSSFFKRIDADRTQHLSGFIRIQTLKEFMFDNCIADVDILCMDVQGFELNILKGAPLNCIKCIILEEPKQQIDEHYKKEMSETADSCHSKYLGAPTANQIREYLTAHSFEEVARVEENKLEDNVMYLCSRLCLPSV